MSTEAEDRKLATRTHYRSILRSINQTICQLETDHIDQHDAKRAGIQQRSMSLESKSDNPSFFVPYEDEYVHSDDDEYPTYEPDVEDRLNVGQFHYYMQDWCGQSYPEDENKPEGIRFRSRAELGLGILAEVNNHHWHVSLICSAPAVTGPLPHVKCLMESEATGDNRLLRSEIVAIIQTMVARLNTKSLRPHIVAPVMLYSLVGPQHLRVLEAYFNGKNLIIGQTKLYDMRAKDMATIDLLTRWWLGFAKGETKSITVAPSS
ncbi:uncharacterized protein BO80DRAFT_392121 [Aspergillus ibericus CBS 121593]|uniref:Uncharacterized protein n=1 Tax=Aspergillus ibericus CBS 121593 TaxID=1448316 RepID=A0A395GLL2_9EURO|nr:hypothetical protein BO80DRAFT_392121 [Aspergillus ibericus CBS 121593]RAK96359.1 hypothetical protein BO80DRAFT_392121 [Aspergillus ibericus CBS 121593]